MDYLERIKKSIRAQINYQVTEDPKYLDEITKHSIWFLDHNKPKSFNPYNKDNELIRHEQEFQSMCAALEENGVKDAKELTVFEFYSRISYYDKKSTKK